MGELGLNKIFGALLATALGIFGLKELSVLMFGGGGHHGGHHEYESLNEWAAKNFAYRVDIAEAGGAGETIEEVFDLGLALASADISRGERSMKGKCASCHTWDNGGANGTGPNLYNIVGRDIGSVGGFGYSAAFQDYPGNWTYEELNGFLLKPSSHIRGTAMSFAGLSRDTERADVIAFLAAQSADPLPFPEPLPAEAEEAAVEGEEAAEGAVAEEAAGEAAVEEAADDVIDAAVDAAEDVASEATDAAEEATDTATEAASGALGSLVDTTTEAADDAIEAAQDAVEDAEETVAETVDNTSETEDEE